MRVVVREAAACDLDDIFDWISRDSPATARIVTERLFSTTELLISFPFRARAGRHAGTSEWPLPRLPHIG
ncbi:type II toxin-antitoxin system RelE/ParE family toxin [Bradyrhizobium sp.]|uniref:type II toxin-antitoxin system RelE/ParE family toxin n=1 Tax=Bradyrhizobium sp. TaxID=376 RepID=UPI0039C8AA49